MRILYVIRHAKSSWDDLTASDVARTLNARGLRDAPMMGKRLKERAVYPQLMLTSHAIRAKLTCELIADSMGCGQHLIKVDRRMYHASEEELISIVRKIHDTVDTAWIFGHNPGLTDFVNLFLTQENQIENIPTCGVVAFRFSTHDWKSISIENSSLIFFDYPKKTA